MFKNNFRLAWAPTVRYGLDRLKHAAVAVLEHWQRQDPAERTYRITAEDPCGDFVMVDFAVAGMEACPCRELAAYFAHHDLVCSPVDRTGRPIEHERAVHRPLAS